MREKIVLRVVSVSTRDLGEGMDDATRKPGVLRKIL